ncbi:zinc finger E-box-binding homeobox 2-like isoform X4 [Ostrea edulis]|uniref:zinc finger E-box-binding homeobox 2-like isoform X4 n=1 Tax=Ostrea edulis TaxID=37623 RepID=UPI0024AF4812|nr:zinc finger E-box-binding homeobox 2-like isoform X4 [Ostrea edulis]
MATFPSLTECGWSWSDINKVEDEVSDIKQQKTADVTTTNSGNHDNAETHDNSPHDKASLQKKDENCDDDSPIETGLIPKTPNSDKENSQEKQEVTSVVLPYKQPSCVTNSNRSTEEDKIQEYLNRSDTAVIYPEPVSDLEAQELEASHVQETVEEEGEDSLDNDSVLEEDLVLKCIYCSQPYSRIPVLKEHMKSAHPDKPVRFQCPKCEETFNQKSHLDKHLALHSPTSQSCKVCNKTFANVYRLQRHMISHDESTDLRKFKCPECGKAFKFKHHLKEHIRIHSGEKPFECPNCHKRFSHSGSYSSHMTSKKCWVAGPKAHITDRVNHMEPTVTYSKPLISKGSFTPPVHMLTSMAQGPFPRVPYLHFDPKGSMPFFTPPPAFVPYTYSMIRHSSPINPIISLQAKTEALTCHSVNPSHANTAQISPDVNSNTQLISMHKSMSKDNTAIKKEPVECKLEPICTDSKPRPTEEPMEADRPPEKRETPQAETIKPDVKMEEREDSEKEKILCHFCNEVFNSAVDQHQHERYLCKANKELLQRASFSDSSRNSPCSSVSDRGTPNGSFSAPDTDHEDDCDSKKFRMRTHISEEQLSVLKSHYKENPRPRKFELIRIGKEIGKEKRVVQVWFQNMRARDRRQGKNVPYVPSMARFKHHDGSVWKDPTSSQSSYIPVVPNTTRAHGKKLDLPSTSRSEEQPLDLSVHSRTPTPAHMGSPSSSNSSSSTPHKPLSLNFSGKLDSTAETPKKEGRLQSSAIYKYLQQEGMIPRHFFGNYLPHPPTSMFQPFLQAHLLANQEASMSHHHFEHRSKSAEPVQKPSFTDINKNSATPMDSKFYFEQNGNKSGRLVIDESQDEDSNCSSDSCSDTEQYRRAMADATLNLATLAEVSLSQRAALMESSLKSKRLRKKSWRQMEAEEVQMDLEDSLLDEDHPLRKKRRSWKGHKIDAEEGMYACDQCAKVFSKQSSLARHKYEHSGARPFTCEICGKAFKHKHHLTEHRRLHSGEKPFECKKCGKRFSHSGSYSQHMNHRYKYCKPLREDGFSSS